MKLRLSMSVIGLSLKENERDGKKFYQMSIDQDGEAGSMAITEDAYKKIAGTFRRFSPCNVVCEYSDQYKYMRIVDIVQGRQ